MKLDPAWGLIESLYRRVMLIYGPQVGGALRLTGVGDGTPRGREVIIHVKRCRGSAVPNRVRDLDW